MEPVNKEIGQPDKFPSQALGLIETSLTTRDKASTSLWFSEKFFLYYYDTDDVDHDYGDYYDDVHEPVMYSFRWIVIVMVIMLQNYKKRWLNILWRSFLSVLAKQTKKKKLLIFWCAPIFMNHSLWRFVETYLNTYR